MTLDFIKKPKFISHYIVALNAIIFAIMFFMDSSMSGKTLMTFGAKVNFLIVDGQYWRLFTVMFLHADFMHLMFNSVALLSFGPEIEMIFGKKKFLIIYGIAGLFGSVGSLVFSNNNSVGASGAIFGLIGANIFLYFLDKQQYKAVYGNQILVLLIINIVYGITNPIIDDSAHLAGFVGGFIAAWAVGHRYQTTFSWKNRTAAILIPVLLLSGVVLSQWRYLGSEHYYYAKGAHYLDSGLIDEAESLFKEGASQYPNQTDFTAILEQIEKFKIEMQKNSRP